MTEDHRVERLRHRSPGEDPDDPYEDVDLADLPAWWRRAIREFREHDLRPYRPPRFSDGKLVHEVVASLEAAYDVDIGFGAVGSGFRERWTVRVDGEPAWEVPRHRAVEGFTVYEIDSAAFERRLRGLLEDG